MTSLAAWAAIVQSPVLGRVGHKLTQPGGPAHPQGKAPAWATSHGCDLVKLHRAHCAHVVHERRGEALECQAGSVRRRRTRVARPKSNILTMARMRRSA